MPSSCEIIIFFFNDTATTEISTLSLHDALPIFDITEVTVVGVLYMGGYQEERIALVVEYGVGDVLAVKLNGEIVDGRKDRKSTRLNSSHANISYAVFCLKKK